MATRSIRRPAAPAWTRASALALALVLLPACQEAYVEPDAGVPVETEGADTAAELATDAPVDLELPVNVLGTEEVGEGNAIEIRVGDDLAFDPTFIRARGGEAVVVTLVNEGFEDHTFTTDEGALEDEPIDVLLTQDEGEVEVDVLIPEDGEVRFFCRFHREFGMKGSFYTDAASS